MGDSSFEHATAINVGCVMLLALYSSVFVRNSITSTQRGLFFLFFPSAKSDHQGACSCSACRKLVGH